MRSIIGACLDPIPTLRRNQKPRKPARPHQRHCPREIGGLNVSAHPNGPRAGPRLTLVHPPQAEKDGIPEKPGTPFSPPHGSRDPFPDPQAMDGPSTVSAASGLPSEAYADWRPIRAHLPRRLNFRRGPPQVLTCGTGPKCPLTAPAAPQGVNLSLHGRYSSCSVHSAVER